MPSHGDASWCARGAELLAEADALAHLGPRLDQIFERAQEKGRRGRATVPRREWVHAAAIAGGVADPGEGRCLDLGTGSGLFGLVMAACWPATRWVFIDRRLRSETFVSWAIGVLEMSARAAFVRGEVAALARAEALTGRFDLVVARAFASPAVTAECATGFLAVGGRLVVSEGEGSLADRWPAAPLRRLGLAVAATGTGPRFVELVKVAPQESRFPRRLAALQRVPLY